MTIFLAANRSPVTLVETRAGVTVKPGLGGLVSLLTDVAADLGPEGLTWVAAATTGPERQLARAPSDPLASLLPYDVRFVDIAPDDYSRYYNSVSNRILWFTHHGLLDELHVPPFGAGALRDWRDAYVPINQRFAEVLAAAAGPSDLVLVQDYHLALVPGRLRRLAPTQPIAHFTHTPFGSVVDMERLPEPIVGQLLDGMLHADLLGFHARRWSDAFLDCCERWGHVVDRPRRSVEHDGRRTLVREYPAPIDSVALRAMATGAATANWVARFASDTHRLIVRTDRLDPSKNIVRGFDAYGQVLDGRPDLRTTRFIASLYRSRGDVPEYRSYALQVERAVEAVNDRHEGAIQAYWDESRERSMAAMRLYDVLLVNPLLDGMNVVSKEGPAVNERSGVVVLSSRAGSAGELGEAALLVDPLDVGATARTLERALDMPLPERRRRADLLREIVDSVTPGDWARHQVADLRAVTTAGAPTRPRGDRGPATPSHPGAPPGT